MLPTLLPTLATLLVLLSTGTTATPTPQYRPNYPTNTSLSPNNTYPYPPAPSPITLTVSSFSAFVPHANVTTPAPTYFIWFRLVDTREAYPLSAHCSAYKRPGSSEGGRTFTSCVADGDVSSVGSASFWFSEGGEELVVRREWDVGGMYIRGEAPQQTYWSETEGGPQGGAPGNMTRTAMGTLYRRNAEWTFPITSIVG